MNSKPSRAPVNTTLTGKIYRMGLRSSREALDMNVVSSSQESSIQFIFGSFSTTEFQLFVFKSRSKFRDSSKSSIAARSTESDFHYC